MKLDQPGQLRRTPAGPVSLSRTGPNAGGRSGRKNWWTQTYTTRTPPSSKVGAWPCPLPRTIGSPRTWPSKPSASSWRIMRRFQRPSCGSPPGYFRARRPSGAGSAAFELRPGWPAVFECDYSRCAVVRRGSLQYETRPSVGPRVRHRSPKFALAAVKLLSVRCTVRTSG